MNMYGKFIIAIDFDGTIVDHKFPDIGSIKKGAKEYINLLKEEGNTIIIWTCRSETFTEFSVFKEMEKFLYDNDIKYDEINKNASFIDFECNPKIYADIYIDDRNLFHVDDWKKIYEEIKKKEIKNRNII